MNPIRLARLAATTTSICLFTGAASADAGVPMLFVTLPAMVVALIPIVILESFMLGRSLNSRMLPRVKSVVVANLASTIIGLPLTWIALVILQMITGGGSAYGVATPAGKLLAVTWQAPWLIPYESELYWMLPAASLVLLVPFFFASYFIEAPIVSRLERAFPSAQIRTAVFRANALSYLALAIFTVGWLLWSRQQGPQSS